MGKPESIEILGKSYYPSFRVYECIEALEGAKRGARRKWFETYIGAGRIPYYIKDNLVFLDDEGLDVALSIRAVINAAEVRNKSIFNGSVVPSVSDPSKSYTIKDGAHAARPLTSLLTKDELVQRGLDSPEALARAMAARPDLYYRIGGRLFYTEDFADYLASSPVPKRGSSSKSDVLADIKKISPLTRNQALVGKLLRDNPQLTYTQIGEYLRIAGLSKASSQRSKKSMMADLYKKFLAKVKMYAEEGISEQELFELSERRWEHDEQEGNASEE